MASKNESEPKVSNTRDLITEFFHDGISRVVPGLVVLALYAHQYVIDAFTKFHDTSLILSLGVLTTAWLIGVTVEVIGFVPAALLLKCFPETNSLRKNLLRNVEPFVDETKRRNYLKYCGEKVMYRGMVVISVFTLFITPNLFSNANWTRWYGVIGGIVFFLAWFWSFKYFYQPNEEPRQGRP